MKLAEKIYQCRRKAGLSQDGLAELLDVSRQTISKWERGEAVPETAKLPGLAKAFGVTIDWLLSEEDSEPGEVLETRTSAASPNTVTWVDRIPGVLGKLIRRWGWLSGLYVTWLGLLLTFIGWLEKTVIERIVLRAERTENFRELVEAGKVPQFIESYLAMFWGFIVIGVVLILAGIVFALVLRHWGKKGEK